MNTTIKKISSAVLVGFVLMMLMSAMIPTLSFAEDKEYFIDRADFEVELTEQGDAIITEKWEVTYFRGSFSHFYKELYSPMNQLEYFNRVKMLGCKINDEDCIRQYDDERIDGHYFFNEDPASGYFTIHWYQHAKSETVKYETKYMITNAVKLNEENNALFQYRFVGEKFPKPVTYSEIVIKLPKYDPTLELMGNHGQYKLVDNVLTINPDEFSLPIRYRLTLDSANFSDLGRVIDVQLPDRTTHVDRNVGVVRNDLGSIIAFSTFAFIFALISVLAIKSITRQMHIKKKLLQYPDLYRDSADRLDEFGVPLTWYRAMCRTMQSRDTDLNVFYIELLELCNIGRIESCPEGLIIRDGGNFDLWDSEKVAMDDKFIDILKERFRLHKTPYGDMFTFDSMKSSLGTKLYADRFLKDMRQWMKEYKKRLPKMQQYREMKSTGELKRFKKEYKFWKTYGVFCNETVNMNDCFDLFGRMGSISGFCILAMTYRLPSMTSSDSPTKYTDPTFWHYLDTDATFHPVRSSGSSSSGGSGCSSCSSCGSCGGCGGGGAD